MKNEQLDQHQQQPHNLSISQSIINAMKISPTSIMSLEGLSIQDKTLTNVINKSDNLQSSKLFSKQITSKPLIALCPSSKPCIFACTNNLCQSQSPFICSSTQPCSQCTEQHPACMTFIKYSLLIEKLRMKRSPALETIKLITQIFNKWIDQISELLQKMQAQLQGYGLDQSQQNILKLFEEQHWDEFTSKKLNIITKDILDDKNKSLPQKQLIEKLDNLKISSQNKLDIQLANFQSLILLSRSPNNITDKSTRNLTSIPQSASSWRFDSSYRLANCFLFSNDNKSISQNMINNHYYHSIGTVPFNDLTETEFSVKIQKTSQNCIMFGIGPNNIDRDDAHYSRDCISYWGYNGSVWVYGTYQSGGITLTQNDIITIKCNKPRKLVTWLSNKQRLFECDIPEHLLTKKLYPIFGLLNKQDTLQIYTESDSKRETFNSLFGLK